VISFGALCGTQLVGRAADRANGKRWRKSSRRIPRRNSTTAKSCTKWGRVEEAIRKYEFAISRDPSLAEAEFYLGLAWRDLGDLDKAQEHYERSFALDPKNGKCESNLAGVLLAKGLRTEARRRYEHSIILNPLLQIAHKELGDIICGTREYQAAIAHYEQALRIQPDFAEAKQNLSFARTLAGR